MKNNFNKLLANHRGFSIFIAIYVVLGILNLAELPIVWTDEVQHLDPVFNYFKNHSFSSKIWPNPGADKHFLSYPPLITNLHLLFVQVLPNTVFFIRLPFLLATISTFVLLYLFLIQNNRWTSSKGIWLIVLLFALDKSVFEISRSMRIEPWIWLITISGLNLIVKPQGPYRNIALSALAGLLLIAHLYMWPLALLWLSLALTSKEKGKTRWYQSKWSISLIFLLPVFITYFGLNANPIDVLHQLGYQSSKHTAEFHGLNQFSEFFWGKFWPYYKEQPLTPILFLSIILLVIWRFKSLSSNQYWLISSYAAVILPQALILTPHIRYFGTHWLISLVVLSQLNPSESWKNTNSTLLNPSSISKPWRTVLASMIAVYSLLFCSGYFTRHAVAFYQRDDRNPKMVFQFLEKHFSSNTNNQKQTVIFGEPIVDYYTIHRTDIAFGLSHYPEHWKFKPDSFHYFVFHKAKPCQLHFLKAIDSTGNSTEPLPTYLQTLGRAHTYRNIYLYSIESQTQWDSFFSPYKMEEINGK